MKAAKKRVCRHRYLQVVFELDEHGKPQNARNRCVRCRRTVGRFGGTIEVSFPTLLDVMQNMDPALAWSNIAEAYQRSLHPARKWFSFDSKFGKKAKR